MNNQLQEAFEQIKPELANRYANMYRYMFNKMSEALGPELKNVYNDWRFVAQFNQIRDIIEYVPTEGTASMQFSGPRRLNENLLPIKAAQQADFAVAQWIEKVDQKLGDLSDVSINHFGGCEFVIFGSRDGKRIKIEQDVVLKQSPKGKLFNQFPARIYVDGKFTSEAAYKKMFN